MRRTLFAAVLIGALLQTACLVGPNYQKPKINAPPAYRGPDNTPAGDAAERSLGDEKWWAVFKDEQLQKLIRLALQQSFDLRLAAARVELARAQVVVARSNQFPSISGVGEDTGTRTPPLGGGFPSFTYNALEAGISGSWDIDFWGKYRRATEAARANLLSTEWGRRAVVGSLVSNVASAYFELRLLDLQLEISRRTLASRKESLQLTSTLVNGGASPLTDQRQAEQLVETAAASIPDLERQIQQQENAINILLGQNPGVVPRGLALTEEGIPLTVPVGLPSRLLARRPDIEEDEQNLIAYNAEIGVARAAFFPDVQLTGLFGVESASLTTLFRGASRAWNYTGSGTQPIFEAGRLRGNLEIAQAQRTQALLSYQQAIQGAFRDVSNA